MAWARFDDGYTDHPKVESAGPWAELLDMRAVIHCARYETDGHVSRDALRRLGRDIPRVMLKVEKLVEVGRWEHGVDGGWEVRDFLIYNPSKARREHNRRLWREQKEQQRAARTAGSEQMSVGDSAESPPKGSGNTNKNVHAPTCECGGTGWVAVEPGVVRKCERPSLRVVPASVVSEGKN